MNSYQTMSVYKISEFHLSELFIQDNNRVSVRLLLCSGGLPAERTTCFPDPSCSPKRIFCLTRHHDNLLCTSAPGTEMMGNKMSEQRCFRWDHYRSRENILCIWHMILSKATNSAFKLYIFFKSICVFLGIEPMTQMMYYICQNVYNH